MPAWHYSNKKIDSQFIEQPASVVFSFSFASLVSPFVAIDMRFFEETDPMYKTRKLLKQSYIILSWFYYFTYIEPQRRKNPLRFFVFPVRHQIYTLTKAPMAHKTWSKEQYKFQFYFMRVSLLDNHFYEDVSLNFNQTLIFLLSYKNRMPLLTTNLMLLKIFQIRFTVNDENYFNFFKFIS